MKYSNAQLALITAVKIVINKSTSAPVEIVAKDYLKWLEKNSKL